MIKKNQFKSISNVKFDNLIKINIIKHWICQQMIDVEK